MSHCQRETRQSLRQCCLFGKEEINAGDHALMFRSTSLPCKYILPFSIAKTVNDSLSENFRLILEASTFLSEDGRELEISADFGTTRTEDTPKPMVSCYIYDAVTGRRFVLWERMSGCRWLGPALTMQG